MIYLSWLLASPWLVSWTSDVQWRILQETIIFRVAEDMCLISATCFSQDQSIDQLPRSGWTDNFHIGPPSSFGWLNMLRSGSVTSTPPAPHCVLRSAFHRRPRKNCPGALQGSDPYGVPSNSRIQMAKSKYIPLSKIRIWLENPWFSITMFVFRRVLDRHS